MLPGFLLIGPLGDLLGRRERGGSIYNHWGSPVQVILKGSIEQVDGDVDAIIERYKKRWEEDIKAPPGLVRMAIEGAISWASGFAEMASPDLPTARASFKYLMPRALDSRDKWILAMMGI